MKHEKLLGSIDLAIAHGTFRKKTTVLSIWSYKTSWLSTLVTLITISFIASSAHSTTPPCSAHKSCVVERASTSQRSAIEREGLRDDLAESIVERNNDTRHWLRCWQHGVLINERIVTALPAESRAAKTIIDGNNTSVIAFDLRNAVCIAEVLPSN